MKTVLIRFAAAGLALFVTSGMPLLATSASAQMNDHLQCFKIKDDAAKAKYSADIASRNTAIANAAGCEIKVPAKWLCVEAARTNTTPDVPGAVTGAPGQTYLCYQTKCPDVPATVDLADDFGSHTVTASKTGMVCAPVAPTCSDGLLNNGEAGVDCGGPCAPCSGGGGGMACTKDAECPSGLCVAGVCADASHCSNNTADADETAVDCGGSQCGACNVGSACAIDRDCASGACEAGLCAAASCTDNRRNQDETAVDCGGTVCGDCPVYAPCLVDGDCATGYCWLGGGICDYAFCHDAMPGMYESGTDCGGSCRPCNVGDPCNSPADCYTGICDGGTCANPTCSDPTMMCGGPCGPCGPGGMCNFPSDCFNGNCQAGFCQP